MNVTAINPKVIGELRALQGTGSPVLLADLIDVFLKDAAVLVSKLLGALESRDARTLERSAHALKRSCGNLGAQAMSRLCADLQTAGHAADWGRVAALLPGLDEEFRIVRIELESEKGRP